MHPGGNRASPFPDAAGAFPSADLAPHNGARRAWAAPIMQAAMHRIVMAGAGPAHLVALRKLATRSRRRVALTLVAPAAAECYSGMVPGIVAGLRDANAAAIPLRQVAQAAGAAFVEDRIVSLDLEARIARLARHAPLPFDVLSLNLGTPGPPADLAGAADHAVPLKPLDAFITQWETLRAGIQARRIRSLAMVGAGAAGVEIVLAIAAWRDRCRPPCELLLHLVDRGTDLAGSHSPAVRRALSLALQRHHVRLWLGSAALAFDERGILLPSGARVAADAILLALPGHPSAALGQSGLACNATGHVEVDACLRSRSHPFVLAAGDCAALPWPGQPRSGAVSVRQGPVLAHNLLAMAEDRSRRLRAFRPRAHYLALIATGDDRAVLSFGSFGTEGRWVHRLKEHIDRRWVADLRAIRTA